MTDLRKIDALVAEHVMNLPVGFMSEQDELPYIIVDQATASFDEIPNYSTDIADARRVVEKVRTEEVEVYISGIHNKWYCDLMLCGKDLLSTHSDPSLPLAICVAALKLKGIRV